MHKQSGYFIIRMQKYKHIIHKKDLPHLQGLTFFLSLIEPLPRTIILHPVSASSCLAVSPLGPRILPTKLNWGGKKSHHTLSTWLNLELLKSF